MKRKILSIILCLALLASFFNITTSSVFAATVDFSDGNFNYESTDTPDVVATPTFG